MMKETNLIIVSEVVLQVSTKFDLLCCDIRKVDKESRAHVSLQFSTIAGGCVISAQKVAILQKATASDFFRCSSID